MELSPDKVKNLAAWISIAIVVVTGLGVVAYVEGYLRPGSKGGDGGEHPDKKKDKKKESGFAFNGGPFESSGVVSVPGTDGVLFIDDGRPGEVYWVQLDGAGRQSGDVKDIPLGVEIDDPEDITTDGKYFYVIGSHTRDAEKRFGLARFAFDPATTEVSETSPIPNLRKLLIERVPELKEQGSEKGKNDGINIEGIAWDPDGRKLLLGLRSPLISGQALIVPIGVRDPAGPFTIENLSIGETPTVRLSLDGQGIRCIQYDSKLKTYWIISGATEMQGKGDFSLWRWDGRSKVNKIMMLDPEMKPEGITRVQAGGADFIFVVGDSNRYIRLDDIDDRNWMR